MPRRSNFFVFLITLKDLNIFPPILRLRKSAVFANVVLEIAQRYHVKYQNDYMIMLPREGKPDVNPLPFSEGLLLSSLVECEQVAKFFKEMQTRMDIERLYCHYLS